MDFSFWLGLLWEEGFDFAAAVVFPTIFGVLGGLLLAVIVFAAFKLVGLVNRDTPGWARGLAIAWLGIALPFTLGSLGCQLGFTKAARKLVTEGRLADTVVPQVGGDIADLVIQLDGVLEQHFGAAEEVPSGDGDQGIPDDSLDVAGFVGRVDQGIDELVGEHLPRLAGQIKEGNPVIGDGTGEKVFDWFVERFNEQLLRSSLDRHGVVSDWFTGLPVAAEKHGSGGVLSRQALAEYTVESLVRTALARPFKTIAKIQKFLGAGMLILAVGVPALGLLVVRSVKKQEGSAAA